MTVAFEDPVSLLPPRSPVRIGRTLAVALAGVSLLMLTAAVPGPDRLNGPVARPVPASVDASPFHDAADGVAAPVASQHTVPLQPLGRPGFAAPVDRFVVSSTYGLRRMSWEANARLHRGIDLAAPLGDPVRAIADGVVTRAGWRGGYGLAVDIRHADGLVSTYAHLSGIGAGVGRGTRLAGGTQIGEIGSTGSSTGPHLHLELRGRDGVSLDPGAFLGGGLAPGGLRAADTDYRRAVLLRSGQNEQRIAPAPPKVVFVREQRPAPESRSRRDDRGGSRLTFHTDRPPVRIVQAQANTITVRRD
ncbi:M23 family metallopeptidase [uncultured Brevundimonas sp.]|uniref:M23 family metallopeptidase n=1 Tax=uncultured Brevundimonas sp. TaxID=213418 RepID=UPI0030EC9D85|tara:strand:- start:12051 stop:12962 length:912 start_codon:yes stop_codon:yes gene_type:complete